MTRLCKVMSLRMPVGILAVLAVLGAGLFQQVSAKTDVLARPAVEVDWNGSAATVGWRTGDNPAGTSYVLERRSDGGAWSALAPSLDSGSRDPSSTTQSHEDHDIEFGVRYEYRVTASHNGASAESETIAFQAYTYPGPLVSDYRDNELEVSVSFPLVEIPSEGDLRLLRIYRQRRSGSVGPVRLVGTLQYKREGDGSLRIVEKALNRDNTLHELETRDRLHKDSRFGVVGELFRFADRTAVSGETYKYGIDMHHRVGNTLTVRVSQEMRVEVPTVVLDASLVKGGVHLQWDQTAEFADAGASHDHTVHLSVDGGDFNEIHRVQDTDSKAGSYVDDDTEFSPDSTYVYQVRLADTTSATTTRSNPEAVVVFGQPVASLWPATNSAGGFEFELRWGSPAGFGHDDFTYEVRQNPYLYDEVSDLARLHNGYEVAESPFSGFVYDDATDRDVRQNFDLRAVSVLNTSLKSPYTGAMNVRPSEHIAAAPEVTFGAVTSKSIEIIWSDPSVGMPRVRGEDEGVSFRVYRFTTGDQDEETLVAVTSATRYVDTDVEASGAYWYRVKAVVDGVGGRSSQQKKAQVPAFDS